MAFVSDVAHLYDTSLKHLNGSAMLLSLCINTNIPVDFALYSNNHLVNLFSFWKTFMSKW